MLCLSENYEKVSSSINQVENLINCLIEVEHNHCIKLSDAMYKQCYDYIPGHCTWAILLRYNPVGTIGTIFLKKKNSCDVKKYVYYSEVDLNGF